jgi:hypothetical protein
VAYNGVHESSWRLHGGPTPSVRFWAKALFDLYFPVDRAAGLMALTVDEHSLDEEFGEGALTHLAWCVGEQVGPEHDLMNLHRLMRGWQGRGAKEAPEFLPYLALSVVAATQMGDDDTVSTRAFYEPLRMLLYSNGGPDRPKHPEVSQELWETLASWLNATRPLTDGLLTFPTGTGTRKYIGYAICQAVIRPSDRSEIRQILASSFWLSDSHVRAELRRRAVGEGNRRLISLVDDLDRPQLLDGVIQVIRTRASGKTSRESSGATNRDRRAEASRLAVMFSMDSGRPTPRLVLLRPGYSAPFTVWIAQQRIEFSQFEGSWFEAAPGLDVGSMMELGCTIRVADQEVHLRSRVYNEELGEWESTTSFTGKPVLVCVSDQAELSREMLATWFSSVTDPGLRSFGVWSPIAKVTGVHAGAGLDENNPLRAMFGEHRPVSIKLEGGLFLKRRHYLVGAAPTLVVGDSSQGVVELCDSDGVTTVLHHCSAETASVRIELAPLCLEPGPYVVTCSNTVIPFSVIRGNPPKPIKQLPADAGGQTKLGCYPVDASVEKMFVIGVSPDQICEVKHNGWIDRLFGTTFSWQIRELPDERSLPVPFKIAFVLVSNSQSGTTLAYPGRRLRPALDTGSRDPLWVDLVNRASLAAWNVDADQCWKTYERVAERIEGE